MQREREREMGCRVRILLFFLLVSIVVRSQSAESAASEDFVLTLDASNFSETVSKHRFVVVEFYASWCGYCQKFAPEYEKAASILSSHDPPVILAKVDCDDAVNTELAGKFDVKRLPTLMILRDGGKTIQQYKGPHDNDGIVEYLKKQTGPSSYEIKSSKDAGNFINEKKIYVVGVFSHFAGEEFSNFTTVAEKLRSDYEFGHTLDAGFLPRGDSTVNQPTIRLFKPFDELVVDSKNFHVDAMEKFVEEASTPIITIFDRDHSNGLFIERFFSSPNAKTMLFMDFNSETFEVFKSTYHEVAQHYKGKSISFLMGDLKDDQNALKYFGLREDQLPLILIQKTDDQKYLKQKLQPDHIAPWLKDYMDGNVKPYIKSEPIPEDNDDPVKAIVADNLHDVVFKSGKNVLLEFYAPWCGHCKNLAPILDEVAVTFKSDKDVLLAKIDATANDIPSDIFDVKGYPTLYFSSASGRLVKYDGNMSKEHIIEFIQKNMDKAVQTVESLKDEL